MARHLPCPSHDATRPQNTRFSAILIGANLTDAKLEGANLTNADLADANLDGATLNSQLFGRAKLTGADLTGAKWSKNVAAPDGWVRDPRSGRLRRAHAGV